MQALARLDLAAACLQSSDVIRSFAIGLALVVP